VFAGTCILFGDGAGAAVLTTHDGPCAILGADMNSDGAGYCHLNGPIDPSTAGKPLGPEEQRAGKAAFQNIYMAGQDVYKFAVRAVPKTLASSLADAGLQPTDIDWLVMHQANKRILDAAAKKLQLPDERVVSNLAEYGNTSAASIPIALDEAVRGGAIKSGDILALAGFGAGLTWASAIVRWQ
jgi:3-oxoacyl-[acyl-carrier-protein] synthase III